MRAVVGYAGLRIAYAVALLAAPARVGRPWLGEAATRPGSAIAIRGLGGRDLALSAGAAYAAASGGSPRPWLAACAVSDAVDLIATLITGEGELPSRAKPSTVVAAGSFCVAGAVLAARSR